MDYGFWTHFNGTFDAALARVAEALQNEGFGILTEIDVQATLKKKLDIDRTPYRILGACNPQLANAALEAVPDIGLLLPCNVVVRESAEGKVEVGFLDPGLMAQLVDGDIQALASEARERLQRVASALAA